MLAFEEVSETVSRATTSKAGTAAERSRMMANPAAKRGALTRCMSQYYR
jgi:hypothetical protein